jgi:hypothetical protein
MSWAEIEHRRTVRNKDNECRTCIPPKRHVGCRDNCEYWAKHEVEKDAKYEKQRKQKKIKRDSIGHCESIYRNKTER